MSPSGAADAGGSDDDPALGHWWFLRSHQHYKLAFRACVFANVSGDDRDALGATPPRA